MPQDEKTKDDTDDFNGRLALLFTFGIGPMSVAAALAYRQYQRYNQPVPPIPQPAPFNPPMWWVEKGE